MTEPRSTQEQHPVRASIRTGFQVAVGLISLAPYIVAEVDVPVAGWGGQVVAVAVGVARVMALPPVAELIRRRLPWLAPDDAPPARK